jgi:hypothetical protein
MWRQLLRVVPFLLGMATVADGQEIRGELLHQSTQRPIHNGLVRLVLPPGAVVDSVRTDSAGAFRFSGMRPGSYALVAGAAGYVPSRSRPVRIGLNEIVTVELLLDTVVLLDPIVVRARDAFTGWLAELRIRQRFYEPLGGRYLTRADFEWTAASTPSEAIAYLVPGYVFSHAPAPGRSTPASRPRLTVKRFSTLCEPMYYLNHHQLPVAYYNPDARIEDFVSLVDVTAIEIYRPGVPPPMGVGGGCGGSVVFWTLPDTSSKE